MNNDASQPKVRLTKLGWVWLGLLALAFAMNWLLGKHDDATELTPNHDDILTYCVYAAGVMAAVSAAVGFLQSKGHIAVRALAAILVFGLLGGLATLLLSSTTADIIENRSDFRSGNIQTYWALLPIGRAYRSDSRTGSSWIIQPLIWSNIDISHADYRFMLSHSGRNDEASEPASVPSNGHFCAKVEIQQSGNALRVLHAGTHTLPTGTVGICSDMRSNNSSIAIIQ